ncbi:hypothetical protein KPL76_00095 [Subtercola sp. PAMC28395]|uniref:hypothetical protein n=1 Tax=Subtercola sp. PAMC28395 TaxID=2846775 RepID=UPI001C0BAC75|nr:hypothetical protein [Subtercola sp. PAMC28395]QWT23898.1 hypothetical protein KPL76_00095 [Subtercola sp. PAMC28395]
MSSGEAGEKPNQVKVELDRVIQGTRDMMATYVAWGNEIKFGANYNMMYGDIIEFLNFRLETAESCLLLIEQDRIADALGLCRAMLENYLLFKLLCRGDKFFQLQTLETFKPAEVKARLLKQQEELAAKHANGEDLACLYVEMYPRRSKHLMYVFKGLRDQTNPNFFIPYHYFLHFQEFRPEAMRLKDEDYFDYTAPDPGVVASQKTYRLETTYRYQHYLSYDALLQCLEINDLMSKAERHRINAHYTFLGTFLHPTDDAAKSLHINANHRSGRPAIGKGQEYTNTAKLLASLYVAHLVAGMLNEVAGLLEKAPSEHVADAGTSNLRTVVGEVEQSVEYFWFIENDAPLYDRFNYAVNWATDEDLQMYGDYSKIPSDRVKFTQHVYSHFAASLRDWSNPRVGIYKSPLD